jgi:hypothetical protein
VKQVDPHHPRTVGVEHGSLIPQLLDKIEVLATHNDRQDLRDDLRAVNRLEARPQGLKKRMERFLAIAHKYGIAVMFVLFDDCAFGAPPTTEPYLGKQNDPTPGMIMPCWTPSPGLKAVTDRAVWPDLERFVKDLLGSFALQRRDGYQLCL